MDNMLKEAIDFAIEKEQEAVDFYTDLAKKIKHKEIAEEIAKLADMEAGHKKKLQAIDISDPFWTREHKNQDLKIADYIVPEEPSAEMNLQDVLALAMQRELAAKRLYTDLAAISSDENVKKMFLTLADEEAEHKNYFERIWDDKVLSEN
ncbi:MAG: ferritin family protein [Deltaproteobacteria bacterium]|nr:ferritin family protein [Deltaproteobacteria bacterium]